MAEPTALADWVDPTAPAGPLELELPLPAGVPAAAAALGVPVPTLVLVAFVRVVGTLAGETDVAVGLTEAGAPPALLRVPVPDGSWRDLVAAVRSAAPAAEPLTGPVDAGFGAGPAALAVQAAADSMRLRRDPTRFDAGYAARAGGHLTNALTALAADPDALHAAADLLTPAERRHLVHGLAGASRELPPSSVPALLAAGARSHPDRPAVSFQGEVWTYGRLQAAVDRVAGVLLAAGLAAEDVVAVSCPRSPEWIAAILGVLRAGGAFLPVEPGTPPERVGHLLRQSAGRFVLTGADGLPGTGAAWSRPVAAVLSDDEPPAPVPDTAIPPDRLAYIYFTSGSTGLPKGAMCEQGGLLNHLLAKIEDLDLGLDDVVAQSAQQSFDISLWQFAAPLLLGAQTLVVSRDDVLDVRRFLAAVVDGGATVIQVVPSYLDVLLRHLEAHPTGLGRLRLVSVTGEAVSRSLVSRWFGRYPAVPLVNAYGATEACDDATHEVLTEPPAGDVPVGRPLRNVTVYVLGAGNTLRPLGAPGEIAFSGICVGRGYVNDPDRTAAAFGPDPFRPGERLYRTGDIGRWLPSGRLSFAGRRDDQVKVNGIRIELGEVEHAVLGHPRVQSSSVVAVPLPGVGRALVAFYTSPDGLAPAELHEHLAALLPPSSMPIGLHALAALPLTANGKVDKRALVERVRPAGAAKVTYVPDGQPRTPTERRLAAAWATALERPAASIGRHDSFFDIGGGSLSALRVVGSLNGLLSLADLTSTPVLSDLAAAVDRVSGSLAVTRGSGGAATVDCSGVPDAAGWAAAHRDELAEALGRHGALHITGLAVATPADLAAIRDALGRAPVVPVEPFAARTELGDGVWSPPEWAADREQCLHHEQAYGLDFPALLLLACLAPARSGGQLLLGDTRAALAALPGDLVDRFRAEGWRLERTFRPHFGLPWAAALGTSDRSAAEQACAERLIGCEWQPGGVLHLSQRRSAIVTHLATGDECWFNDVGFFSAWAVDAAERKLLVSAFGERGLPFNTGFGDGRPLTEADYRAILAAYDEVLVRVPLRAGDLVLVDNLLTAHGREPYTGSWDVAVAPADPVALAACRPTVPPAP
jgi:amino acid adenylation domain-containing protein